MPVPLRREVFNVIVRWMFLSTTRAQIKVQLPATKFTTDNCNDRQFTANPITRRRELGMCSESRRVSKITESGSPWMFINCRSKLHFSSDDTLKFIQVTRAVSVPFLLLLWQKQDIASEMLDCPYALSEKLFVLIAASVVSINRMCCELQGYHLSPSQNAWSQYVYYEDYSTACLVVRIGDGSKIVLNGILQYSDAPDLTEQPMPDPSRCSPPLFNLSVMKMQLSETWPGVIE